MRNLLLLFLLLIGITVQGQLVGVVATAGSGVPVLDQYYDFDRSALAYLTTDMVLDGETNISVLYRGKLLPNGGVESRIYGFDDSHTDLFLVWDDDKVNEFTWQLHDGTTVSNIYESWATDSAVHTFICVYDSAVGVKMYIDGTEVYTSTDTDFTGWVTTGNIQLGTKNNAVATAAGLLGTMDRFQVYDRAITPAEVTTLQTDIAGVTSGKLADFGDQKTATVWTDDVSGYEATDAGDITLHEYVKEFPQDNAAALSDDNSIGSFVAGQDATVTVDGTTSQHGSYSIKVVGGTLGWAYGSVTMTGMTANAVYKIGVWAKGDTVTEQNIDLPISGGWTTTQLVYTTSTAWTYYEIIATKDATTTGIIYIKSCEATVNNGGIMWADEITIVKQ